MLKNMLLASAAAFVVLGAAASLTNMKAVITSGSGADAALTRDATDFNAQLRELRTEQVRQATLLSVQNTTIRALQRDLAEAEKMAAAGRATTGASSGSAMHMAATEDWSIGLDMPTAERAERAAEYQAAWLQAMTLGDDLAATQKAYNDLESNSGARMAALEQQTSDQISTLQKETADKVATLERNHRFAVERLQAEIEERDNSIVGLMHRIVAMQTGNEAAVAASATVAAARPARAPQPAPAPQPSPTPQPTMAKAPAAAPAATVAAAPATARSAADEAPAVHGTLADGVAAYRAGDYHKAFEIWRVLANAGDTNARFHLGALYYEGRGVERQLETAQVLLSMAAAAGSEKAAVLRDKVAAELAREQVAKAPGVAAK